MTVAVALGALFGLGCIGVIRGMSPARPTLETIAAALDQWPDPNRPNTGPDRRPGAAALVDMIGRSAVTGERWRALGPCFAVTGEAPEETTSKMLVMGGAGLVAPPLVWLVVRIAGVIGVPVGFAIMAGLLAALIGLVLPVVDLMSRARGRQHHLRLVVGTFVDLVVLNLAGGMGIESALVDAAQVSSDWAAVRISRCLVRARESGQPSWVALSQLGQELGADELVELAATLQLAGTEGSRIRQSLSARAAALRRHEQADAESAANRTTERLFLPGALLLMGFLLFVGYPAFSRIVGGF